MRYSAELRDAVLRRVLPPQNDPVERVAREEGISEQTVRNWKAKALDTGYRPAEEDASLPDRWTTQDKFHIVLETAGMNEAELGEYARVKGLYVEQIHQWRDACINANGGTAKEAARLNRELKGVEKKNRQLERELIRKEKALAEAAALMILRKNWTRFGGSKRANDQRPRSRKTYRADRTRSAVRSRSQQSLRGMWHHWKDLLPLGAARPRERLV